MKHISKLAILLSVAAVLYLLCAVAMLTPMQNLGLYGGMALSLLLTASLFYITLHLQKVTHVNDNAKTDNDKKDEINKDGECKDDKQNTPETVEKAQENSHPTASLDSKDAASNASDEASKSEQNQDASDKT